VSSNSGGPLLASDGEVLAVNTLLVASKSSHDLTCAIHSAHLATLMETPPRFVSPLVNLPHTDRSDKPVVETTTEEYAEHDIMAWESISDTLNTFTKRLGIPKYGSRNTGRNFKEDARLALETVEQLERIPVGDASSLLRNYCKSLRESLHCLHLAARGVGSAPRVDPNYYIEYLSAMEAWERRTQIAAEALSAVADSINIDGNAVRNRLQFLHKQQLRKLLEVKDSY